MVRFIFGLIATLAATLSVQAAAAPDRPPAVEDYGRLPALDLVTLSPSGARYAFVGQIGDQRRVVVSTTDNKLLQSADVGKVKVLRLTWAGDDHLLITTSATTNLGVDFRGSRAELSTVTVLNIATHKAFGVFQTHNFDRVVKTVVGQYGAARIEGRWYGFFGGFSYGDSGQLRTIDHRIYPDLYRVDLDTGEFVQAAQGQSNIRNWLIAADGSIVARSLYDEKRGDWSISAFANLASPLDSGRERFGGGEILGFGKTYDRLLVRILGEDDDVYEEIPLAGGAPTPWTLNDPTDEVIHDPVTHLWIGVEHRDDNRSVRLFDKLHDARVRALGGAFPGYRVHLISYSADFDHLIVFTDGGDDSGAYWIVNFVGGAGKGVVLGEAYPTVTPAFVGPVRMIDYKAGDGMSLRAVLTLPPGRTPKDLPLVVMPHGGPAARDYPRFDYWAQAFAARGYAVLQPNFRGSTGYGVAFRNAGFGEWGRKMQTDISDGVAELARQGIVDPKRACIVGWSYGGYAAQAGVTVQQGLYKCTVSMAGVSDLPGMLDYEQDRSGELSSTLRWWKTFMGVKTFGRTELKAISPVKLADRADAPMLLIHGTDDTVVPLEQSQALDRALKAAGKPVEFVTLKGADHWLLEEDARMAMVKASVDFVMKYDPPDPAPTALAAK